MSRYIFSEAPLAGYVALLQGGKASGIGRMRAAYSIDEYASFAPGLQAPAKHRAEEALTAISQK